MSAQKVHHLDCGTMCPVAGSLIGSGGHIWNRGLMVCHCLLIETDAGLVLVESGLGTLDIQRPSRLPWLFRFINAPPKTSPTALHHVKRLGFAASDVRHIVLTHLDLDHAGGLSDFPNAMVHVSAQEFKAASSPTKADGYRYQPKQWSHEVSWQTYEETDGESWFGFEKVRPLTELGDDLALVPLTGHSAGHCAVAVRSGDGWLMHCGDGFFHRSELSPGAKIPWGIRQFQKDVDYCADDRLANVERLLDLQARHNKEVTIFCSHDPVQLELLQGTSHS